MRDILGTKSYMDTVLPSEMQTTWKVRRFSKKKEDRLTNDEYAVYLKLLRQQDDRARINNLKLATRKKLIPLLRTILMLNAVLSGIRIKKLNQRLPETDGRPVIFVLTHVGKEDQIVFSRVIKKHYTILSGDYESLHNSIEGIICKLNGILFFDMRSEKERREVESRVESILKVGDNILCAMEAAWNLSPNVPVMELFPGMIRCAVRANAVIIPVGIERFSKKLFGVNIAASFFDPMTYVGQFGSEREMLNAAREDLRLQMADIKMQLYFHHKIQPKIMALRSEIGNYDEYNEKFKKDILEGWTFTEKAIQEKAYKDPNAPKEVFAYVTKKYAGLGMKGCGKKSFEKMLVELISDIKNPIYPNEIHNKLQNYIRRISGESRGESISEYIL